MRNYTRTKRTGSDSGMMKSGSSSFPLLVPKLITPPKAPQCVIPAKHWNQEPFNNQCVKPKSGNEAGHGLPNQHSIYGTASRTLRTEPLDFVDGAFDAVPIYPDGANSGGTILYWILYVFAEFVPLIGSLDSQGTPVEQSPQP